MFASDDQFDNKKKQNIAPYFFELTSCSAVREAERNTRVSNKLLSDWIPANLVAFQLMYFHIFADAY